ncbi:hypothetical protein EV656_104207 [Rhodovulum adriaticum]|uniref:Uncharacterized protein n=1 Tax=Rhodovulum adriaticum TaxID=35804 RepID=A0A4R2NNR2_RHOAD|nr:hypothetical protein EV656_104207 [Rhodovulum adriaticum]
MTGTGRGEAFSPKLLVRKILCEEFFASGGGISTKKKQGMRNHG